MLTRLFIKYFNYIKIDLNIQLKNEYTRISSKKNLKDFGAAIPNGVVITDLKNIDKENKKI